MLTLPAGIRVFAYAPACDLRRGFDRLAAMVRDFLRRDPMQGHLFLFRNKSGDRMKILWHEPSGFWIFYKRLHRGTFRFPQPRHNAGDFVREIQIDAQDLALLLEGVDLSPDRKQSLSRR